MKQLPEILMDITLKLPRLASQLLAMIQLVLVQLKDLLQQLRQNKELGSLLSM
jgi:hypothetical protein